jgi:hypothetical protein
LPPSVFDHSHPKVQRPTARLALPRRRVGYLAGRRLDVLLL